MFTGIIQAIGRIQRLEPRDGDIRLVVKDTAALGMSEVKRGDSIAVNGVCLTVVDTGESHFTADVSRETLAVTSLGLLEPGKRVNLEKALTLATPLGGHLVSGHVDGLGRLLERRQDGRSVRLRCAYPTELSRYIAPKGSICIDGVSLTVNHVEKAYFALNIVPHTLAGTIIDEYREGQQLNLEVDLIARYLERLLQTSNTVQTTAVLDEEFLVAHGFIPGSRELANDSGVTCE